MYRFEIVSEFAKKAHDAVNCEYDGKTYYTHLKMVEDGIEKYQDIFIDINDYINSRKAGSCHDLTEDARLNFNDIRDVTNIEVARIVLGVTDVHEENRLLRHLATMGKTVKDYRAIIVKMADLRANASYSRDNGSSMYEKYMFEYNYRRPIFKKALTWYEDKLNMDVVNEFWNELDEIHGFNQ